VRASGDEFGDGMSKCTVRCNVEDGVRVLAVVHATFRENDGQEMDAR